MEARRELIEAVGDRYRKSELTSRMELRSSLGSARLQDRSRRTVLGRQGSTKPRSARPCTLRAVLPIIENRDGRLRWDELFGSVRSTEKAASSLHTIADTPSPALL